MGRVSLNDEFLDKINGGALGFDPEQGGTYTMRCQYSGKTYTGVSLGQVMEIAKFCATIPNNAEGEQKIIQWAKDNNIISE